MSPVRGLPHRRSPVRTASVLLAAATALLMALVTVAAAGATPAPRRAAAPQVQVQTVVSGVSNPWGIAFLPDRSMIWTQRGGFIKVRPEGGTTVQLKANLSGLYVGGETGLMGIAVDPDFVDNQYFYTCGGYQVDGEPVGVRVLRWRLSLSRGVASLAGGGPVRGLPITTGRHGGCQLVFGPDQMLYVGTGDAAVGTNPQDLGSLGGKVLRVHPDGRIPTDNPFYSRGGNARYVWTYGHRNVQGLAVRPGTSEIWSAEHGPDRDDEVNRLAKGGNYGWNPVPGYDESVPMTDTGRYPAAVPARWSSGSPTVATSGLAFLSGSGWGRWNGALAVAELKGQGVRVLTLDAGGRVTRTEQMAGLDGSFGRIRALRVGPDGALYVSTANGSSDRILRVPRQAPR